MGRGRAKAKQTKVARELKYHSPDMDLGRLRSDLGAGGLGERPAPAGDTGYADDSDAFDDPYADVVEDDERPSRR